LSDAEVLTLEVVGEFLGIDTDKGLWEHGRRYWKDFFPQVGTRTSFLRQAANLWAWKLILQHELAASLGAEESAWYVVDAFPMPVCQFKRAYRSEVFRGEAAYGFCASKRQRFYGFLGHVGVSAQGILTALSVTAANIHEPEGIRDLAGEGILKGTVFGDKGYIGAALKKELARQGIELETALRKDMKDDRDPAWVRTIVSLRHRIETVIAQLCERFHIERVRARDRWHLTSRLARKLLAHTMGVFLNKLLGREPLQFEGLIAA
jgi:hypothetical protein